jgi:hypothetical protein
MVVWAYASGLFYKSSFQRSRPSARQQTALAAAHRAVLSGCGGKGDITVFLASGVVTVIASGQALRAMRADRPRRKDCCLEKLWHAKARKLIIPLSAHGHPVGQRGARTGVAMDTCKGRFSMLPDKRSSRIAARDESAAPEVSTPRRIAGSG